jgi:Flp pilus assembly protein TadD
MDAGVSQPGPPPFGAPPDDGFRGLYVQGLTALRDGRTDDAIALLIRALRREPGHRGMRRTLVRALLAAGRFDQVLAQADAALAGAHGDAELHFARGTALSALGRPALACAAFSRAIALQPAHAPTWLNYGNASIDLDDLTAAEALYRAALRLDPALPEAHASLGYVLTRQGRLPEAIEACEAAIRLRPDFAQAQWNQAVATLLSGDLRRGFAQYEWRKRHPSFAAHFTELPGPAWDGRDPAGRTILVRAEQGMGDTIHFARYLRMVADAGGSPVLVCAPALVPLIGSMPGVRAIEAGAALPHYHAWADLMSLAGLTGTIPAAAGYLAACPERARTWRERLPAGPKVGIALSGNALTPGHRHRAIPSELLRTVPGVSFVNLQHGPAAGSLGLPDLSAWMTDYAETAALIGNLDLVVAADTSVAHLAGALGKPVFILLPAAPDWRWMLGRSDSPWYASARLYRQDRPGDWTGAVGHALRDVRAYFDAKS